MEIINSSKNLDKKTAYKLSHQANKMSDLIGEPVVVDAWIKYLSKDIKNEEVKTVLSILVDGTPYATISSSFINAFDDIVSNFAEDNDKLAIEVLSGTSKAGRTFITCALK